MCVATFLPISAGSTSMCTTFARGANSPRSPVTRSSNRAPIATIRSASSIAQLAAGCPCMPSIPSHCGSLAGNAPSAISVVVTGAPVRRASAVSSAAASAWTTPPPAYSTGRRAAASACAASRTWRPFGFVRGR